MRRPLEMELSRRDQLALILLLAACGAPHLLHLNGWISAFFVAMVRLLALRQLDALPGRLLLFLLTAGGLANVVLHYPLLFGKEAGVALLSSMLGLKLMEMRRQRDLYVVVFLGFFTLATLFLYRREPLLVLYVVLLVIGLTTLLVEGSRATGSRSLLAPLRESAILLLQALPIAIVLFIFFPRFVSPLWQLSISDGSAVTGVSDSISMGSISQLSRSSEIAFRVDFDGVPPAAPQRYWRGPVLWDTDGRQWQRGDPVEGRPPPRPSGTGLVRYEVDLEPTRRGWIYALDLPVELPHNSRLMADFQLLSKRPGDQRIRYRVGSLLDYRTGPLSEKQRLRGLQLPDNITPRMRELVAGWQKRAGSSVELVGLALDYFREQPFFYTLYPPVLEGNPADQFLFASRRGFCEHYATSFALLMRIAGIPTRIVAGYQGGEINPVGDYLIVRQSDAHAWNEVWLPGSGWFRVDPTAAVAPERIEQPLDVDLISRRVGEPVSFSLDSGLLRTFGRQLQWGLDALNSNWHRWVLGYTQERQSYFMRLLGLSFLNGTRLAYAMVAVTGLVVAILLLGMLLRGRQKRDPVQRAYRRFCQRLQRRGLHRRPSEGPRDFAHRVSRADPALRPAVASITRLYIAIRYGRADSPANRRRLQLAVRNFRP